MALSPAKKIYLKFLLKFFRITGIKKYYRIGDGFLKGYLFNVNVDNNIFYGEYETDAVEKIISIANTADPLCYYDIGAHYGFFSLVFSKLRPRAVTAFEAHTPNYEKLLKTLLLNKIPEVQAKNVAVANSGQSTVLFTNTNLTASNTFIDSGQLPGDSPKKVVVAKSIDDLVFKDKSLPPGFIKIDVEGAEYEVLNGALSTLKQYRPYILLATHDCHLPGVKNDCIRLLSELGYRTEKLNDQKAFEGLEDFLCSPAM